MGVKQLFFSIVMLNVSVENKIMIYGIHGCIHQPHRVLHACHSVPQTVWCKSKVQHSRQSVPCVHAVCPLQRHYSHLVPHERWHSKADAAGSSKSTSTCPGSASWAPVPLWATAHLQIFEWCQISMACKRGPVVAMPNIYYVNPSGCPSATASKLNHLGKPCVSRHRHNRFVKF